MAPPQTASIEARVERHRQLFSRSDQLAFSAHGPIASCQLPLFAEAVVRGLTFPPANGQVIDDLKGRDLESPCSLEITKGWDSQPEELLGIFGNLVLPQEKGRPYKELPTAPFEYHVATRFESFPTTHHIRHHCIEHRPGHFPTWYSPLYCTRALPIVLSAVRIGFELFESRFSSFSFGYAPVVTTHLLVEASTTAWAMQLVSEVPRRERSGPALSHAALVQLDRHLQPILSWSYLTELQRRM